jgi:hypothetical protein
MSSRSDLHTDFEKLTADATQMADENARLRKINAEMLAALQSRCQFFKTVCPRPSILIGRKRQLLKSRMPSPRPSARPK